MLSGEFKQVFTPCGGGFYSSIDWWRCIVCIFLVLFGFDWVHLHALLCRCLCLSLRIITACFCPVSLYILSFHMNLDINMKIANWASCFRETVIFGGRSKLMWSDTDYNSSVNESASQCLCRSLGNAFEQWMSSGGCSYWPVFPPLLSFCTMVAVGARPKSSQQEIMWVICQPCCLGYCSFVKKRHWNECSASNLDFSFFEQNFWYPFMTPGWLDLWPGHAGSGELQLDYGSQAGFMFLCAKWISAIKFH